VSEKKRDYCHKEFISSPNNNSHGFTFKVIHLKFNALFHPALPRFYSLLEGFFRNAHQPRRYSPLDDLLGFKTGPFEDPLEL